ncbi:hypothetical protein [Bdellovibrio svalbardensis]|uniref:Uncharacterized protein n=1 Tax=Bdellovibrio svalbardensis TaxID=2972972 RepID=A0ABT6DHZ7_9BACT|nr:hypothetical protein [Bdellovibrio svalbardensis]MDG0816418.1 hypothetical protein [Bdellovibrio svalbardensis]
MKKEQIGKPSSKIKPAGEITAQPQRSSTHKHPPDFDPRDEQIDYGETSLHDAKMSGYSDRKGRAVSMTKEDIEGSPTGALTDIGAGRSSVIHEKKKQKDH